jgi:hypothetical protein
LNGLLYHLHSYSGRILTVSGFTSDAWLMSFGTSQAGKLKGCAKMEIAKSEIIKTKQDYFFIWLDEWLKAHNSGIKVNSVNTNDILFTGYFGNPETHRNTFIVHVNKWVEEVGKNAYITSWGDVFIFKIIQLSENRAQVEARCLTNIREFIDVFDSIWNEIIRKFEIVPMVDTSTIECGQMKKQEPFAPVYDANRDRMEQTWKAIKTMVDNGRPTYKKLIAHLETNHPELACSDDTLRKIIKLGKAGYFG